jgi:ABC-2 type transport system permease protein
MWRSYINGAKDIARFFTSELKLIVSDAGAVLFFIVAMFIYSLCYTFGYEREIIRDIPVAIVDLDHSALSRQFGRMADATEQLKVTCKPGSIKEAEELFYDGSIKGVLLIPENFEKDILNGKRTSVTAYCDVSYFMVYKQVYAGSAFSSGTFGAGIEIKRLLAEGKPMEQALDLQDPLKVNTTYLYNPSGGYAGFIMPAMIIIIMQQTMLIGIGMLGGTIREKKIFLKMYGSVGTKWGNVKLILGKSFAYVTIYLLTALFSMGILHRWFAFPDNGHFWPILTLLIPYLLSVSFLGLAISMLFTERVHAMLFMVFLSPMIVFLSGLSWPASAIPPWLYWLAHIMPSTSMIPAYVRMRICGAGLESVHFEWAFILIQMVVYFILACYSYKRAIRKMGKRIGSSIVPELDSDDLLAMEKE